MPTTDAAKAFDKAVKTRLGELDLAGLQTEVSKTTLTLNYPDGSIGKLGCTRIVGGKGPGEFVAYSVVSLNAGPLLAILRELGLDASGAFFGDTLFSATSTSLINKDYPVKKTADPAAVAQKVVADMKDKLFPVLQSFVTEPAAAVKFIFQEKGEYVRNPFALSTVLLGVAGRLGEADDLIKNAEKARFHDLPKTAQERAKVLGSVRAWFEKHPGAVLKKK
jgi:hypothetical protein